MQNNGGSVIIFLIKRLICRKQQIHQQISARRNCHGICRRSNVQSEVYKMKIAIIGYSGCGKSTLAQFLGQKHHVEVLHLDCVHWLPGWEERTHDEEANIICQFMNHSTSWIIDGNYSGLAYTRRLEEADQIIIMRFSRFTCLFRVLKRLYRFRGKTRESMAPGCPERVDMEFLIWILYKGRSGKIRKRFRNVRRKYRDKTIVIKNQRQLTAYMRRENI